MGESVKITYKTTQIQYYLNYLIEHCILAVTFFLPLSLAVSSGFLGFGAVLWISKMIVNKKVTSFVYIKATKFATRGGAVAARMAHNHEVPGSSPGPATKKKESLLWLFFCRST